MYYAGKCTSSRSNRTLSSKTSAEKHHLYLRFVSQVDCRARNTQRARRPISAETIHYEMGEEQLTATVEAHTQQKNAKKKITLA